MPISVTTLGEPVRGTSLLINSGFTSGANISALNVGAGLGVYKNVSSGILNFKSLIFGSGFTPVSNTNDLTINLDLAYLSSNITPVITANKAAVSNGSGAIVASTTDADKIGFIGTLTSDAQTQLNGKQATITGAATTVVSLNLSPNTVAISNGAGKLASSTVTTTELLNLAGSTGNLQAQISSLGIIPAGVIVMWAGTTPPSGWALCDGTLGTPDLRGKFIVGYNSANPDYSPIGKTGGEEKHVLTVNELPPHSHAVDRFTVKAAINIGGDQVFAFGAGTSGTGVAAASIDTSATYGTFSAPHENRPPYYTLAYIIKL